MLLCWEADFLNPVRWAQLPAASADFSHADTFFVGHQTVVGGLFSFFSAVSKL